MAEPVADVLARVEQVVKQVPGLLLEVMNDADYLRQAAALRQLGQLLGELSATVLARVGELDGRRIEPPTRAIIDARS